MENEIIKLSIIRDQRIIPELALFISNTAKKLGLSKRKTYYLCFVLETALELRMNDISDDNPTINICVIDNGNYFKIRLTDFGSPYILSKNQQEILKKKIVDKFSFEQNGRKGQSLSFSYYYDAKARQEIVIDKEELMDENFTFRDLINNDEDILKAIKCLYASYGLEYYHQNLYSVENFKRYIRNGRYTPIIGENEHGQNICYCALDVNPAFEGLPELSNLVTNPIARGKGLATKIFKEAENIAKAKGYEGVHVSAVAYHPYTQKMCNKFNYTPSAIEYSINPPGTGGYSKESRLDCVIGIKIFNKTKKHTLYINKECNEVISSIFDSENLNYDIHNESVENNIDVSDLAYFIEVDTSNCFIQLDICGKNLKQEIKEVLNKKEIKNIDVVTVNLNMNHPNAIEGFNILRSEGFICGGTIMGCTNGDFMIMQNFKVKPNYDAIVLEDNYKELQKKLNKINKI